MSSTFSRSAAVCLLILLGACGGGGADDPGPPPPASTGVGSAGGTVTGSGTAVGASVVIPPGALAANTQIAVTQASAGAPPLPAGLSATGAIFAFTPHGTAFGLPVTVTLPFNPASVPAGRIAQLYKTHAQNGWELVSGASFGATSVSAQIAAFSFAQVVTAPFEARPVGREWSFTELRGDRLEFVTVEGKTETGGDLSRTRAFGGATFDAAMVLLDGSTLASDEIAHGAIGASADGRVLYVAAEAPNGPAAVQSAPIGGMATLTQVQTFIKRAANASLKLKISHATIEVNDRNAVLGRICPPQHAEGLKCRLLQGELDIELEAINTEPEPTTFYRLHGGATLDGYAEHWDSDAWTYRLSRVPFWRTEQFDFVIDNADNASESHVVMSLREPITHVVDISSVPKDRAFHIRITARASAHNRISGAPSEFPTGAGAYLGLPFGVGDATLEFSGLEVAAPPQTLITPPEVPLPPAACVPGPAPDPTAGVLQFSAASYVVSEGGSVPVVTVTRSGGSRGAVSATFSTRDGSAVAGVDYTPLNATVSFADGDADARRIEVETIQNPIGDQADRTVNLALSQPGGCAALGTPATAVLSIRDDDPSEVPQAFTIGGTVAGLAGSGLVLIQDDALAIAANGAFQFVRLVPNGLRYDVRVQAQPRSPDQVCTVARGSGTVNGAAITDVAVDCVTPPPNGSLDTSFGIGGKVSTAFGGDETAMALQADGKILMAGGSGADFVLARYNTDGSLDAGFGSAGTVTTDIAGGQDQANGVAIQADGKIVVVGKAVVGRTPNGQFNFDFALARYNADGSLDTGFGTGGKVTTDFNVLFDEAFAAAIQGDGKIVVVGTATRVVTTGSGVDFAVVRYNTNGTLDGGFGSGGKLTTDIGEATDIARNVVLHGNGTILVSGVLTLGTSPVLDHGGLARYDSVGNLDAGFGAGGKLILAGSNLGEGLAVQADDKILVAGSVAAGASRQFVLRRLAADGSPDLGFGSLGQVTAGFSTQDDFGRAVAVQVDGRILVAGQSSNKSNPDFALVRFEAGGALDTGFGAGGKLTIDFFGSFDGAENVLVQPDGKIVLGGFARNGSSTGYGLARVNP